MKTILAALFAAALLTSAAAAAAASKSEEWTHSKSAHRVSGTAVRHHSATVRPAANAISGGQGFSSPNYASSSLPAYGGSLASGPSHAGSVRPLRPMPRSRTSGAGAFTAGASQGHTYTTVQASPASASVASAGGSKIQMDRRGRSLSGPGVAVGDADTAPGGANNNANGGDPLSKIVAGIGSMFGDMAKAMSAMWGGGG